MQTITNDRDFRIGYEIMGMMREAVAKDGDAEQRKTRLMALKRNLRRYSHRDTSTERRIIKDEGMDGFIALERLPDDIKDLDEAREFFDRFMSFPRTTGMYDCTGRPVTNWFKVFMRCGQCYAYHSVSFDV